MGKNNELFLRFREWANKQGLDYSNDDGTRLMADMLKWSQSNGKAYFNYKTIRIKDNKRIDEISEYTSILKQLILDSDPEAHIVIKDGFITADFDYFSCESSDEMMKFLSVITKASNVTLMPTNDKKVSFTVGFNGTTIPIKITHKNKN